MEKKKTKSFVYGAAILGLAGLICKIIGAFFRIPLYNMLGDGMAYYEAVYPYYSWLLVISSAGIPTAISRMVAERVATGDFTAARRVFRKAQILLFGIGLVTTLVMFLGAPILASVVDVGDGVVHSFRALAPALFFVSLMCAYRGYLQGLQNMTGTAVSQLTEQVIKLIAGLYFAALFLPKGLEYAAMGALLGITLSELLALIVIVIFYLFNRKNLPEQTCASSDEDHIIGMLLAIAVPVTIGASIMPLTGIIDSVLIVSTLKSIGFSEAEANMRYVALRTNVTTVINMPAVLTTALAMSLVPAVSSARKLNDRGEIKKICTTATKLSLVIGLPCAVGLFIMGDMVIDFLYNITPDRLAVAASIMRVSSVGVIFLSLVQTLTGVIQGFGKQQIPVRNLAIGAACKALIMLTVMRIPSVNINGAAFSTVVCYAVAGMLDLLYMVKEAELKLDLWDVFGKPILASAAMGAIVLLSKKLLQMFISSVTVSTIGSVCIGVIAYAGLALILRVFSRDDLAYIPGGRLLSKLFRY